MRIFQVENLQRLSDFQEQRDQLAIFERKPLGDTDIFFQKLMQTSFRVIGHVCKESSIEDIQELLEDDIPNELRSDPFYAYWVSDMAAICEIFCDTIGSESIGFCLGTERGCRRYHIDQVPMRLLVTYAGQGTEWLPDEAADRRAWANGAPNEEIVMNPSAVEFLKSWDIAIFRGGPKGLLHRTPDAALKKRSILMRLDHDSFWDNILEQQRKNKQEEGITKTNVV